MLTAALFTKAKIGKQPKSSSTDEWIKRMRCIYTMEYYSAINWNEILPFGTRWMNLEGITKIFHHIYVNFVSLKRHGHNLGKKFNRKCDLMNSLGDL